MDLNWEQGRGRETQVQPPLEIWRQFFGLTDIYGRLPSFRLINRRALGIEEPIRPAVLHDHNVTVEIAGAVAPRPAILRMVQISKREYEYIVYRPGMTNFDVFSALLNEVENPYGSGSRRWFIARRRNRGEWSLTAVELHRRVGDRIAALADEDEIVAARSVLAELAGEPSEGQGFDSFAPRARRSRSMQYARPPLTTNGGAGMLRTFRRGGLMICSADARTS